MSDAAVLAAAANPFSPSSWLEGAVDWLLEQTAEAISTVLEFVVDAPGPLIGGQLFGGSLDQPLNYAVGIGRYVLPVFVLLGIITWTVRGEPGRILQLLLIETPFVAIGMLLIPVVVAELTGIADALFIALVDTSDFVPALRNLVTVLETAGPQASFLVIAAAFLMLLGGLVTYAVLLIRSVVIAVSVLLGPLLIATRTWEPARGIAGKWVALTAAVVLVKPVIGFMWTVGVALVGTSPTADTLSEGAQATSQLMAGAAVLLLGGLVPTALFKLVPEVGDRVAGSLHTGLGRVATTGLAVAGTASAVGGGLGGSAAGAAAGGGGAGQAAGGGATGAGGAAGGSGGFGGGPSIPVGAYGREAGGGGGAPPTGPAGGPVGGSGPSGGGPSGGSPSGAGPSQSRPAGQGPAGSGPAGNGAGPGPQQTPQRPTSTPAGAARPAGGSSSAPPPPPTNPTPGRQRPDPSRPVLPGRRLPPPAMPSSSEDER